MALENKIQLGQAERAPQCWITAFSAGEEICTSTNAIEVGEQQTLHLIKCEIHMQSSMLSQYSHIPHINTDWKYMFLSRGNDILLTPKLSHSLFLYYMYNLEQIALDK